MNIISQNLKNEIKKHIKVLITPIFYNLIDEIVDNIDKNDFDFSKYFSMFSSIQSTMREVIRLTIVSIFEEIDKEFKNSSLRKSRYFISKSNVPRTLNTIAGSITFYRTYYKSKLSKKSFFYVDKIFDLPKYDHYDPIIKAVAIQNTVETSQAQASRFISYFSDDILSLIDKSRAYNIPRQSIYNWIKHWNVPTIVPEAVDTPETLYVMADEKYIGAQDIHNDIMIKSFVTFEDVQQVSKGRNSLCNRFVYSTFSSKPWIDFMNTISLRYDFSKIKNICLLGDGASWIKNGVNELHLDVNNHVTFYLCKFHFKQAINHITTDKDERIHLIDTLLNASKKNFINSVHQIIELNPSREQIITQKLNYILNNYHAIKLMYNSNIGSSMESHISHCIASFFSSRPKGFSSKRIDNYIKLNNYKNNKTNIVSLYLLSYKNNKRDKIKDKITFNYSAFDNNKTNNIPILNNGCLSEPYYKCLHDIAH